MKFEEIIIKYEPHDCEYTMEDNTLFCRHDNSEEWVEVDKEHCIAEGENHYVDILFDYAYLYERG